MSEPLLNRDNRLLSHEELLAKISELQDRLNNETSRRIQLENTLHKQSLFLDMAQNMPGGFCILSPINDSSGFIVDYLIKYTNRSLLHKLDTNQFGSDGQRLLEICSLESIQELWEGLQKISADNSLYTLEWNCKEANSLFAPGNYKINIVRLQNHLGVYWDKINDSVTADKFRKLAEMVPTPVFVLQGGKFCYVNKAFEKTTGYSAEECLNRDLGQIAHTDYKSIIMDYLSALSKHNNVPSWHEIKIVAKSGQDLWINICISPIEFDGHKFYLGLGYDITERKKAEALSKETERRLADIIDFLPDATFVIDIEGKVIAWNRAAEEMTGISRKDILGKGNYEYAIPFHNERRPTLADLVIKSKQKGKRNYRGIKRKGETLSGEAFCPAVEAFLQGTATPLYDTEGNLAGAIQSIRDVTDRKYAELALQASEEKYRRIVETANEGIWITNANEETIFANRKILDMFGYTLEEMQGRSVYEFMDQEQQKVAYYYIERRRRGISEKHDFKYRRKDGSELWAIVSATPIVDQNHNYAGSLKMITDITERKKLEKQMTRLDRLNIIGEIAAGIGHEIRNPMTSVRGFLQILKEKEQYLADSDYFDLMIEEIDRANSIITEFLSLAKNKKVKLELCSLGKIAEALFPLIKAEATIQEKHVEMEFEEIPDLYLDKSEIRQLLLNLVRNGLEAMESGKTLKLSIYLNKGEVVLSVQDQGKGINPEVLDQMGTPFLTTKDTGTGLGLAVCYSIAARHNATIEVKTGSSGTTFFVRFKVPGENDTPPSIY